MGLRVLLPYDIDTTGMRNPFLFLMLRALSRHPQMEHMQHGYGWLREEGEWDVIHLHWPEILLSAQLPGPFRETEIKTEYIDRLTAILEGWKKQGSKILLTVHNEEPHIDPSGMCDRLYSELYALTDGFIHMGQRSVELLAGNYPEQSVGKASYVIPHGDFRYFPNEMKRSECRKFLGIAEDARLMLSFGAIRTEDELNMGMDAFIQASVPGSVYLMAGKLPFPYKKQSRHFPVRRKLYMNQLGRYRGRILTDERIIPPEQVQHYLNAADLIYIPRFKALNSGNVALGFTFGKVVTGPDYGVIGEVLGATGNPVFDPYDEESAGEAVRTGFELAAAGHGEHNRKYCDQHMNWNKLNGLFMEAYRDITSHTN